jgi:hypothetical protein
MDAPIISPSTCKASDAAVVHFRSRWQSSKPRYLTWALPEQKVFIDGRADVYAWTGVFEDYGRWATLRDDPNRLLDNYQIDWCLLSRSAPLARVMSYLPGWSERYSDSQSVIFARDPAR